MVVSVGFLLGFLGFSWVFLVFLGFLGLSLKEGWNTTGGGFDFSHCKIDTVMQLDSSLVIGI